MGGRGLATERCAPAVILKGGGTHGRGGTVPLDATPLPAVNDVAGIALTDIAADERILGWGRAQAARLNVNTHAGIVPNRVAEHFGLTRRVAIHLDPTAIVVTNFIPTRLIARTARQDHPAGASGIAIVPAVVDDP